jgi:hypothetical protein
MFDHISLRVADLAAAGSTFTTALDELEIEQTRSTPTFSAWGNFALAAADDQQPIARRVRIAFTAPTAAHVDRFVKAGLGAGLADDSAEEPHPDDVNDYRAAFLMDHVGNSFGAVHHEGARPKATSITSRSTSPTSTPRLPSTRRSPQRPGSRSGTRPSITRPSPSATRAASSS